MATRGNWKRLGELLLARRVDLGYEAREAFADETGVASSRVLFDLENAKRTNFSRQMLIAVEDAYEWERGSIQAVLEGGEPTPREKTQRVVVRDERPADLRREIRRAIGSLSDAQLVRVRDFVNGLVNQD